MKNKIIVILTLLAVIFTLNSCLKDDADYWKTDVAGKMYATILKPGLQSKSLLPVADDIEVSFMVNVATDALPTTATTMSFAFNDDVVQAYNDTLKARAIAANDTFKVGVNWGKLKWKDYKPYPSAVLLTPTITIPAGARTGIVKFMVNRADTIALASPDNNKGYYMSAITMTTSNIPIAENMKTVMFSFPIANEYEGNYLSEGFRDHPVAGIEPYSFSKVEFTTINANTVHKEQVGNYGGYGLDITVTDEVVVVNGVDCFKVTLLLTPGSGGDPGAVGVNQGQYATFEGNPINYYNPVTKVFELYYWYNGAAPRKIRETDSRI